MITLSSSQVKHLHRKLLNSTGGIDGIRDEGMLDSALSNIFQTFGGVELYPSAISKIARITYSLVCNLFFATPKCRKLQSKNVGCCNYKM